MVEKRCDKCKAGELYGNMVICRRYPGSSDGQGDTSYDEQPRKRPEDWCWEFK